MRPAWVRGIGAMIWTLSVGMGAKAAVIFQDDFEADRADWACADGQLSRWDATYLGCGSTPGFGSEWKMGPGRGGGNAVHAWKKDTVPNGYRSESDKWLAGSDLVPEFHHRWSMKVPPEFNKSIAEGFKLWRYIWRENGFSNPPQTYLNVAGGTFAGGTLVLLPNAMARYDLVPVSAFNDGQWHTHEVRIKLNSDGQTDGVIQYWLDGILRQTYAGVDWNVGRTPVPTLRLHRFGVGIGNVSDSPWFMADWTAAAFDDVTVGTAYIGPPGGTGDVQAPAAPRGMGVR